MRLLYSHIPAPKALEAVLRLQQRDDEAQLQVAQEAMAKYAADLSPMPERIWALRNTAAALGQSSPSEQLR